jgi:hypothetical protein
MDLFSGRILKTYENQQAPSLRSLKGRWRFLAYAHRPGPVLDLTPGLTFS